MTKETITLTYKQQKWLDSRARDERDLFCDGNGLFVNMSSGRKGIFGIIQDKRVYLPID